MAEQPARPPPVEWIALALPQRAARDDRRQAAEGHEPVVVRRPVEAQVPAEGVEIDQLRVDQRLPAPVPHLAEVLEALRLTGPERRRKDAGNQGVPGGLVVARHLDGEAI